MVRVTAVRYLRDYVLWLRFDDGAEGEIDLAGQLIGEVFEPLHDVTLFAAVRLDAEIRTVAWPNGADLAPEFLRELLRSHAAA
jgi:hypothetical protein